MNEPLLVQVLEYHIEWLEDGLKPDQGKWIYSILACLSLPLSSEICSSLRDLARQCIRLRNMKVCTIILCLWLKFRILNNSYFFQTCNDSEVVVLNLIICLVSKYFGQLDLGD